ncbi:tRNA (guanosine(46)-N7)-methyltransferase TrmB [Mycobacterium sp. BMJ-28]
MSDDVPMHAQRQEAGSPPPADSATQGASAANGSPDAPENGPENTHHHRRVSSFRSRRSTLTGSQQDLWERRWPELGAEARDGAGRPLTRDIGAWFGRQAPVVLEIGCGTGISTLAMAIDEPHLDVVAVEVYRRGLAQLLSAITRNDVPNIRLIRGDGLDVLEHIFPTASLTGVRVFFPDPWPKARHHKRRLLQPETVALIADRLVPGGILHAATDHAEYAEQIAEVGDAQPLLRRADGSESLPISVRRPETKYEGKGLEAGRDIAELIWVRTLKASE